MASMVNVDGEIQPAETARISVLDHGFLYGDSVYETLRAYDGRCFALARHLERLALSAAAIALVPPIQFHELANEIARTLAAAGESEAAVRVMLTRGAGPLSIDPAVCPRASWLVYVRPYTGLAPGVASTGVAVVVARRPRNSSRALDPAIKSGNFLNNILAAEEAKRAGAFEAILLNHEGLVAEASQSNIFAVAGDMLLTPALSAGLLAGITREHVLALARGAGIPCAERDLFVTELYDADELFLTSSLKEIVPVIRLGARPVGGGCPGPVTRRLGELYATDVARFRAAG